MPLGQPYDGGPALALPLETEPFTAENRDALLRLLQAQDQATVVVGLDDVRQVLLDQDGRTVSGSYRFTNLALRHLCRLTVYGLAEALYDLSGQRRRREEAPDSAYSLDEAIRVLNLCLNLRFSLLEGVQLVVDESLGVIEGLVGTAYRRLSNLELFERAEESADQGEAGHRFHEAVISNRTMMLPFRGAEIGFTRSECVSEPLREGIYYINSEVGEASLRLGHLMFRPDETASASWARVGGRITHQGRNFATRFSRVLGQVNSYRPDPELLTNRVQLAHEWQLGVETNAPNRERAIRTMLTRIRGRGWSLWHAKRVLRELLWGADETRDMSILEGDNPERSCYDFYAACTKVARRLPIASRERMEYLAHLTLTSRFQPVYRAQV